MSENEPLIERETMEILPTLCRVDQGTITITRRNNRTWKMEFPDSSVRLVTSRPKAYSIAREWFQRRIGSNEIGIGKIEWIT